MIKLRKIILNNKAKYKKTQIIKNIKMKYK